MKTSDIVLQAAKKQFELEYPNILLEDAIDKRVFELINFMGNSVGTLYFMDNKSWGARLCRCPNMTLGLYGCGSQVSCVITDYDDYGNNKNSIAIYTDDFEKSNPSIMSVRIRNTMITFINLQFDRVVTTICKDEPELGDNVKDTVLPQTIHHASKCSFPITITAASLAMLLGYVESVSYPSIENGCGIELEILSRDNIRFGLRLYETVRIETEEESYIPISTEYCRIFDLDNPDECYGEINGGFLMSSLKVVVESCRMFLTALSEHKRFTESMITLGETEER